MQSDPDMNYTQNYSCLPLCSADTENVKHTVSFVVGRNGTLHEDRFMARGN